MKMRSAGVITMSSMVKKYNEEVDRESAYEMLTKKLEKAAEQAAKKQKEKSETAAEPGPPPRLRGLVENQNLLWNRLPAARHSTQL